MERRRELADLIAAYEDTAMRWGGLESDAAAANRVFQENHSIYKRLRDHEAGREGIASLMSHDSEWVRPAAATHSLAWEPERATATLDAIEHSPGLIAVDARDVGIVPLGETEPRLVRALPRRSGMAP